MTDEQVLKYEIGLLLDDLKKAYDASGKKVSGEFGKGLTDEYKSTATSITGTIVGYTYLAGRMGGKMPPVKAIEEWVKKKGIFNVTGKAATSLAWAIAKKIAREGTNKSYNFKIYESVITPLRIQQIIDRIAKVNVNRFITQITAEIEVLAENV